MYQLKIGTIPLPKLYVCSRSEARECRKLGIPYIIKPDSWSDEKLVKAVLLRTLMQKFPYIKWLEVLNLHPNSLASYNKFKINVPHVVVDEPDNIRNEAIEDNMLDDEPVVGTFLYVEPETRINPGCDRGFSSIEMEYTDEGEYRETGGGLDPEDTLDFSPQSHIEWHNESVDSYIGDLGHYVNIEELQSLRLLPTFLDDIANAIKLNLMNAAWCDGYNKKLDCNVGNWQGTDQAPNLIILDVSGSIPRGVAGTMISLIETLRHQANADLIITSTRSEYWPANTELPTPDQLSRLIGGCNECVQFYSILREHILGKHWGNVIIFGDMDSPLRHDIQLDVKNGLTQNIDLKELQSTRIDRIMAFHTRWKAVPGYGLWAVDACPKAEIVFNTNWVDSMKRF